MLETAAKPFEKYKRYSTYLPVVFLLAAFLLLTGFKANQSSVGMYDVAKNGEGVLGADRPIRSDEWLVRLPWILSQEARDFEPRMVTAGHHSPAITYDLPTKDYSLVLKPHLIPYLIFDVDRAVAAEWWLLVIGSALATYVLIVALGVARSLSFPLSLFMAASPGLHWWTVNSSFSIIFYGALGATAFISSLRANDSRKRVVLAIISGWLFGCSAVVLYPPFQIPTLILIALLLLIELKANLDLKKRETVVAATLAGLTFSVLVAGFLLKYKNGLGATASTVYPGARRSSSGDVNLVSLFGVPFDFSASKIVSGETNGLNQSENSSTFLLALPTLFLLPFITKKRNEIVVQRQRLYASAGWFAVLMCWMLIPLPAFLGSITLLNRVPPDRIKPSLSFISVVLVALFAERFLDDYSRRQRLVAVAWFGIFTLIAGSYYSINGVTLNNWEILKYSLFWILPTVIFFCFSKKIGIWGLLLVASLSTLNINPIHRSVSPLYNNSVRNEMLRLDPDLSASWVTFSGNAQLRGIMVASGARVLSAVSPYPDESFWKQFDPDKKFEDQWNRYGHVQFTNISGPTRISSPQADVIKVEIDICETLQSGTLLIELNAEGLDCLNQVGRATYQGSSWTIFRKN